ncbi:phage NrS-1 polymerase family protein [Haloferax profundi]|uniref:NrS-1 polymerase-like HBD domain-containing protein n=1 Tax=Haloferax profundi TaxID=1544718 RepID=A0A0W1SQ39_9EURY|nr:hypothetical protein [Haloferax profundi]KTG28453.1 hypothetical protein AUR66_11595 [Haloferax profundi]
MSSHDTTETEVSPDDYERTVPSSHIVTEPNAIPDVLKQNSEWLVVLIPSDSDKGKPPIAPNGGSGWADESRELLDFDTAYETAVEMVCTPRVNTEEGDRVALGYRFTSEDGFTGIDIDDAERLKLVEDVLQNFENAYIEWSVSGEGQHIIVKANAGDSPGGKLPLCDDGNVSVEIYDKDRYFVFTGDAIQTSEVGESSQEQVDELLERVTPSQDNRSSPPITSIGRQQAQEYTHYFGEDNSRPTITDILNTAEKYDREFRMLFRGGTSGYPSQSEADMALASKLAFWCRGDLFLMDRCFRRSNCYDSRGQSTAKWDEAHYGTGETYGERTLKKAIENNSERFEGSYL